MPSRCKVAVFLCHRAPWHANLFGTNLPQPHLPSSDPSTLLPSLPPCPPPYPTPAVKPLQFHLHTASEHLVNGELAPVELHIVTAGAACWAGLSKRYAVLCWPS